MTPSPDRHRLYDRQCTACGKHLVLVEDCSCNAPVNIAIYEDEDLAKALNQLSLCQKELEQEHQAYAELWKKYEDMHN